MLNQVRVCKRLSCISIVLLCMCVEVMLVKRLWQGKPIHAVTNLSSASFAATSPTFFSLLILTAWSLWKLVVTGWSDNSVLYGIRMCSIEFLKVKHQVLVWPDWMHYTLLQLSFPTILFNIITLNMTMGGAIDLYSAGSRFGSSTWQVLLWPDSIHYTLLQPYFPTILFNIFLQLWIC
jgi:hypothetical protein